VAILTGDRERAVRASHGLPRRLLSVVRRRQEEQPHGDLEEVNEHSSLHVENAGALRQKSEQV
jgi:hypothetical protein